MFSALPFSHHRKGDVYGDGGVCLLILVFRTRALQPQPSHWADYPAQQGSAAAVTAGIAIEGAIRCGVHTLEDLDLAFRSEEDNCFSNPTNPTLGTRKPGFHSYPCSEFHHDLDLIAYIYGVKTSLNGTGLQICKYGHYLGIFSFYLYRIIDEVRTFSLKSTTASSIQSFSRQLSYTFPRGRKRLHGACICLRRRLVRNDLIFATHCIGPPFEILAFTLT